MGCALSGIPILLKEKGTYLDFTSCEGESEKDRHKFAINARICKCLLSGSQENEGGV